jgi:phosphoribosylamine--glycine ligase
VKVLIIGSGGREHTLMWKLAQSPHVHEFVATPGNAGMATLGRCVATEGTPEALVALAKAEGADLTVVGPEGPLVEGVVDQFEAAGLRIFGPNREAAQLEGSKRYAKDFMARHGIPSAAYRSFTGTEEALAYLHQLGAPVVVKDSRLAAGKGVTVATVLEDAQDAVTAILGPPGGGELVIEEFLTGQELSLLLFTDGKTAKTMLLAQDYKQAHDGDTGPMTGGMGTVAPVALLDDAQLQGIMDTIVTPTLRGLQAEGILYKGVMFIGLMVTEGGIKVLEYNVRFGDPETQVVLPLLENDLLEIFDAVIDERLHEVELTWRDAYAACVVMAAPGYPGGYPKGLPLALPEVPEGGFIFHAGTEKQDDRLVTNGGRVLGVTALADGLEDAVTRAYTLVEAIDFPGAHYRKDIGSRLLKE